MGDTVSRKSLRDPFIRYGIVFCFKGYIAPDQSGCYGDRCQAPYGDPFFLPVHLLINSRSTISSCVTAIVISFSSSFVKKRSSLDSLLMRSTGSSRKV